MLLCDWLSLDALNFFHHWENKKKIVGTGGTLGQLAPSRLCEEVEPHGCKHVKGRSLPPGSGEEEQGVGTGYSPSHFLQLDPISQQTISL